MTYDKVIINSTKYRADQAVARCSLEVIFNSIHSEAEDEGSLDILIREDATLEDLKLEIQKRYHGLEPYLQVLIFKGDIMADDERKLFEYGIDEDDTELELETAKICEECGGRVYRIGEYASEECVNCDQRCESCNENMEADEGA